jgi:hypothetical protein
MPDYDLKNIPVLEDIIEIEETDPVEPEAIATLAPDETENNFDLFIDNSTEAEALDLIDTTDVEIDIFSEEVITEYIAAVDDDSGIYNDDMQTSEPVFDGQGSAQEPMLDPTLLDSTSHGTISLESASIDIQTDKDSDNDPQPTANQHPVSIENLVNEVIKQLMPDLEQQLRLLVQQALEDKLPENIITQLSDKSDR